MALNKFDQSARPRISVRPAALLTWLFVTFILATGPLQLAVPDQSGTTYFSAAALGGLGVVGALLAAQVRRARAMARAGVAVERIELGLLSGRVVGQGELTSPRDLRRVSWAGPLTLVGCALALGVAGLMSLAGSPSLSLLGATALMSAGAVAALAILELVPTPGSPGSQLIFARAWRRSGERDRAIVSAARAGMVSGWGLLAAGAVVVALYSFAGIWLILIGGLVIGGSRLTLAGARTRQRLAGLRVADVMSAVPPEVSAFATAGEALVDVALPSRAVVLLVRDTDGSFGGLVNLGALASVPGDDRDDIRVRRLAIPPSAVAMVGAGEPVERALEAMAAHPVAGMAVVFDQLSEGVPDVHSTVVGVVTTADLARTVEVVTAAGVGAAARKF